MDYANFLLMKESWILVELLEKNQVLLGGNMGYGFHTVLMMGPKAARVFR